MRVVEVHGRAAFILKVKFRDKKTGALIDLTDKTLVFEMEGGLFRTTLGYDEARTPTVRVVYYPRDTVASFPTETTKFIIVDETVQGMEVPVATGKIKRIGWT